MLLFMMFFKKKIGFFLSVLFMVMVVVCDPLGLFFPRMYTFYRHDWGFREKNFLAEVPEIYIRAHQAAYVLVLKPLLL